MVQYFEQWQIFKFQVQFIIKKHWYAVNIFHGEFSINENIKNSWKLSWLSFYYNYLIINLLVGKDT
jgi:hypothetical protein